MTITGNLEQIRAKVRKVTGMPSTNQLSNNDLDDYINDFYLYDFPAHLKNWNLKTISSPIAGSNKALIPNQAIYTVDINAFTNLEPPFYVGGYEIQYFQDIKTFFYFFPQQRRLEILATGTGVAGPYSGTISNIPILKEGVFISTVNNNGDSLNCTATATGVLTGDVLAGGTINYETGVVSGLTWNSGLITNGTNINVQTLTYQSGRPQAVLFYDDNLVFYPVPDIAYEVNCVVCASPDELTSGKEPNVRDWWSLIAYGASLKIFADNLDMDSYSKVDILFDRQKRLVERRTLAQLKNQRVATIYTQGVAKVTPFSSTL